jgi:2-methylisocitrate lyase-like PEP mutase family enzyme
VSRLTIRDALASETPLITPLAHDALSARPIELAGFCAFTIGGAPCWRRASPILTLA